MFPGERELVEFLAEEIAAERKAQKKKTLPAEIDGFKVKLDGADVELIKDAGGEKWGLRNALSPIRLKCFSF